jgi:hypothetical protein
MIIVMSYKNIDEYCHHFSEGNCNNTYCMYGYHIKCKKNINCFNFECQYGHSVSCNLRKLFKLIVNENTNPQYQKSKNKCYYAINCFKTNCIKEHMITKDAIKFVNHILKNNIYYDDALIIYNLQFKKQTTNIKDINRIIPVQLVELPEALETAKSLEDIDPVLKNNLLNLTEAEDEPISPIKNDREDLKSKLLQELMISQNNIKQLTKELYDKDIAIQTLMNQRNYLESKIYQNKSKIHKLTMNIMYLGNY